VTRLRLRVDILTSLLVLAATVSTFGCAVGRTRTGSPVVGLDLGAPLPETLDEGVALAATTVGGLLGPPWSVAIPAFAAAATGIAGAFLGKRNGWRDREKAQSQIDAAWDEATARRA